nr:MAG TPA: hypothetical protein [Caudoviricetes sp.]
MEKIQLEENTTGTKTIYIEGLTKRIKMDITDMEFKILRGMSQVLGFTEANELACGNFICCYYSDRNVILKPIKRKEISIYYNLDYDSNNMYLIIDQYNTQKIKMQRDYKKKMIQIMENLGKRLEVRGVI